jgi:hypothetical protein
MSRRRTPGTLERVTADLVQALKGLRFGPPVSHVYHPLIYAAEPHRRYLRLYGDRPKEVVLVGMNPGPWGMAQTGVPFGEIGAVRGRSWVSPAPAGRSAGSVCGAGPGKTSAPPNFFSGGFSWPIIAP